MRYTLRHISFSLILLIMIGAGSEAAENEATPLSISVMIDEQAVIANSMILLDDIAVIESSHKASADKLRKIHISSAAVPERSRTLHIGYIKSRVRQQGILPESINWSGAEQVAVKTKAQYLSPEEILSCAEKYLREQRAQSESRGLNGEKHGTKTSAPQNHQMQFQPLSKIRQAVLPCGEVSVNVESMSSMSRNGNIPLKLTILVDGRECEKRLISFKVATLREVLVTTHALARNKIIQEDDLCLALRDISGHLKGASVFSKKEDLIGKRTRQTIRQGATIVGNKVEDTPIINPGDLVTIVIESSAFKITAQGRAREAGVYGRVIRVMNTASMKEVAAEVINEKLVRVPLFWNK